MGKAPQIPLKGIGDRSKFLVVAQLEKRDMSGVLSWIP